MKNKLLSLLFLSISSLCLSSCSLFYHLDTIDNIDIAYSDYHKNCFIAHINYNLGSSLDITLLDEYKGYKVTNLGGYFGRGVPSPFTVEFMIDREESSEYTNSYYTSESYLYDPNINWWDEYEVINFDFNITLPKYLKNIVYVSSDIYVQTKEIEDDKIFALIYRPTFYFTIDENNKYFYTKDGRLFDKNTNNLCDEFVYRDTIL